MARATIVVPLAGLEAALDEDLLALSEELAADLSQTIRMAERRWGIEVVKARSLSADEAQISAR